MENSNFKFFLFYGWFMESPDRKEDRGGFALAAEREDGALAIFSDVSDPRNVYLTCEEKFGRLNWMEGDWLEKFKADTIQKIEITETVREKVA